MLKNATYKEKITLLKKWVPHIIDTVKKDLKTEHLKEDGLFAKRYFLSKNINKLTTEELVQGYAQAIADNERAEDIAEFLSNRWLLRNTELYQYFEQQLSKINPNFSEITEIEPKKAQDIIEGSIKQFGAPRTYLFSVLNSVVFPESAYTKLSKQAEDSAVKEEEEAKIELEQQSAEAMKRSYEQNIARLTDKYEKKLQGLQKKYLQDTESLKKQIANLQRKLG